MKFLPKFFRPQPFNQFHTGNRIRVLQQVSLAQRTAANQETVFGQAKQNALRSIHDQLRDNLSTISGGSGSRRFHKELDRAYLRHAEHLERAITDADVNAFFQTLGDLYRDYQAVGGGVSEPMPQPSPESQNVSLSD